MQHFIEKFHSSVLFLYEKDFSTYNYRMQTLTWNHQCPLSTLLNKYIDMLNSWELIFNLFAACLYCYRSMVNDLVFPTGNKVCNNIYYLHVLFTNAVFVTKTRSVCEIHPFIHVIIFVQSSKKKKKNQTIIEDGISPCRV